MGFWDKRGEADMIWTWFLAMMMAWQLYLDVPAVQEDHLVPNPVCVLSSGCDQVKTKYWTCADKSRVLLTAEDGSKHCVKF